MRWLAGFVVIGCAFAGPVEAVGDSAALIDLRMARMEEQLELSAEQILEIRPILEETYTSIAFAREEAGDDLDGFLETAREELERSDGRIEALLVDDQKKAFDAFKKTRRVDLMTLRYRARLGLSEEQTAQVYAILVDANERLETLRAQRGGGNPVRGPRGRGSGGGRGGGAANDLRALGQETDERIEAVLTIEQLAEYRQLREEQRALIKERRRSGDRP
jgi:hypothetical protein